MDIVVTHSNLLKHRTSYTILFTNISEEHHFSNCPGWRHQMKIFSAWLAICAGNSPVTGEFPAQRPVALVASLICVWINGCVNNREAGDLRRHRAHNDVIVMMVVNIDHDEVNELMINSKGNVSVIKQPCPWVAFLTSHTFLCRREQNTLNWYRIDVFTVMTFLVGHFRVYGTLYKRWPECKHNCRPCIHDTHFPTIAMQLFTL